MKRALPFTLTVIGILFCTLSAFPQSAVGSWNLYSSYHDAVKCVPAGEKIFVLSDGSLYSYLPEDGDIQIYNKENSLSENNISFIEYAPSVKTLVIVYKNANIDLLDVENDDIYNITDFKNKSLPDKTINFLKVVDDYAYLATNFGVVTLNLAKREFSRTFTLNQVVRCSFKMGKHIIASTSDGVFKGKDGDNLSDVGNWNKISPYIFHDLAEFDNRLIVLGKYDGIYSLDIETKKLTTLLTGKYNYLKVVKQQLIAANTEEMVIFDNMTSYTKYTLNGKCNYIVSNGNSYWTSEGSGGLNGYEMKENTLIRKVSDILPNSPRRNYCDYMTFAGEERLLIAGGCLNYFDYTFYEGTLMIYEKGKWSEFKEDSIAAQTGEAYMNMTSIVQDPEDSEHHFASSFGHGLYEFRNREMVQHYTYNNSPIETAVPDPVYSARYVRVPRLVYDTQNNLWMTNTGIRNNIKILKKDGTWKSMYYSEIANLPTVVDIYFDLRGWIWLNSMRMPAALFCINPNGTPYDESDDITKIVSTIFTNQDGEKITLNELNCMVEDRDGTLWLGTDQGVFTLYSPQNFFNTDYYFTQIKIPRNDGTNYADYLFDGVYISAICVDGANRKWIGTQSNGIYLISADGLETLHHFTQENSPLTSDNIVSIACHPKTGEVFIGTDAGLVSYMSDATEPEDKLKESNIHAYPNPVSADYSGPVTITGLTFDCNVKIVSATGKLICEGISSGGQYSWDGTARGDRVASGVYYVLTTDEEGNEGVATKILVIGR